MGLDLFGFGDLFNGIGNLVSAGTGVVDTIINYNNAKKNFEFQNDQYNYSKDLQKEIFSREDNSVQRRVRDLEAAGLSPILAAGSSANSGSVVSTSAPQNNYHSDMQTNVLNVLNGLLSVRKQAQDIATSHGQQVAFETQAKKNLADAGFIEGAQTELTNNNINLAVAELEYKRAQTEYTVTGSAKAKKEMEVAESQIKHYARQNDLLEFELKQNKYQFEFDTRYGGSTNKSELTKMTNEIANFFDNSGIIKSGKNLLKGLFKK